MLFRDDQEATIGTTEGLMKQNRLGINSALGGAQSIEWYCDPFIAGMFLELIVMDVAIPGGMECQEAVQHIKAMDPNIPAIVSSGNSADKAMPDFRDPGFCGGLKKPCDVNELGSAARIVLGEPPD